MCAETGSFREDVGAGSHAKLMSSPRAVGLLAILVDAGDFTLRTFGKQELRRHILAAHTTSSLSLVEELTPELSPRAVDPNPPAAGVSRARVKKVRFAPDVVDPAGDSRAYRGKNGANMLAEKVVYKVKQAHKERSHNKRVSLNDEVFKASQVNSACKAQTLAKPYIPANRMLLYKGKQLSRSMMTLDVRV